MIAADTATLASILDDTLVWTHSSGVTESKAEVLAAIAAKSVSYLSLEVEGVSVRRVGDAYLMHGTLQGRAARDGKEKALANRFLAVWHFADGRFQLLAWQSTGF